MADIEQAIYARLVADVPVNTIVEGRVFPVIMPDNSRFPCITFQRIAVQREHLLEGRGNFASGEFVIECWVKRDPQGIATMADLAKKVRDCVDGVRGTLSSVDVQGILSINEFDIYEPDVEVFRRTLRFRILYRE